MPAKAYLLASTWCCAALFASQSIADEQRGAEQKNVIDWGYAHTNGPQEWDELGYELCESGKNQTPINIEDSYLAQLPAIEYVDQGHADSVVHNGHTIKYRYKGNTGLYLDDDFFQLAQFHFHTPSEHLINGENYPLEAHFVHHNAELGQYLVIGIFFKLNEEDNPQLDPAWAHLEDVSPAHKTIDLPSIASSIIQMHSQFFQYNGSLTTPPCTEGVRWLVQRSPHMISQTQLDAYKEAQGFENARPEQPINARDVLVR